MTDKHTQKKPYSKPEVAAIDLVPGEVLLEGCKTSTGGGAGDVTPDCIDDTCIGEYGS
ncbi:MAG: hypothetical protein ISS35_02550 [Kiritimatiellae bacterium]|nr:hypothetical protein [Kiritimatiellia bacterium]